MVFDRLHRNSVYSSEKHLLFDKEQYIIELLKFQLKQKTNLFCQLRRFLCN